MASSIKSAGKAVHATSGASTNSRHRHDPAVERVSVHMFDPAHTFAPVDISEGSRRGTAAAFALLREIRSLQVSHDKHAHVRASIRLRDFIAHAGAARLAMDASARSRCDASREWAGYEALKPFVDMVLWALPNFDFDGWEQQALERLQRDGAFFDRHRAEQRERFVQRMREGRARAQARRAQGGAQ